MKYKFLPDDYEAPRSSGNYMKFEEGENRVRILTAPILGWEDWHDKTPVRYAFDKKPAKSHDPKRPVRHFWAMVVWNYNLAAIQIMHVTQASIRKAIETLCADQDWGEPYSYDIKIYKSGEGVDTEYTVNPTAPKPISQEIILEFHKKPCWLEALFTNADPFADHGSYTKAAFESSQEVPLNEGAKPVEAKAPEPKAKRNDSAIDLELFMDFMPGDVDASRVEEFILKCAEKADTSVEEYCTKAIDNVDHFVSCYTRWLQIPQKKQSAG